ncbi:MAG TPA: response regulator [Nitrospiraceae bacterium]|jgi:YesN/AraC family two-component response regulator|nr:response regulator [Nitrospiraceae bacterium]
MEAVNGHEGLALYRRRPTDLVITDIAMSELNGLDLILELTRYCLDAKVIAISGIGDDKNVLDVAKLLGARRTIHRSTDNLHFPYSAR